MDCKARCIQDALIEKGQTILDKRNGEIVLLSQKGDYEVYMREHTKRISCSSASIDQFDCVEQTLSYLDDKASQTNGRLSYPFYTLKQGLELDDHDTYFAASEKVRINALMSSLCRNGYIVQLVEECAYCPFSGGGGTCIS